MPAVDTQIKAIIFDLDGVLVDACEWHYQAFNLALSSLGKKPISEADHLAHFNGKPSKEKIAILIERGSILPEEGTQIWLHKQTYTRKAIEMYAFPDMNKIHMLSSLREDGFGLACVTNSIYETAELMLRKTGCWSYLDTVISNQSTSKNKPHPDPYLYAMQLLNVTPNEALILEDAPVGINSATASGAHVQITHYNQLNYDIVMNYVRKINNATN